jgi:hypothetical protein
MKITNDEKTLHSHTKSKSKKNNQREEGLYSDNADLDEYNSSYNERSEITKYKTYNNSSISIRFSQQNYEKCLLTIILILLMNITIWYLFYDVFTFYFSVLFYITCGLDIMTFLFYFICVLKLRKDEIFTVVSFSMFELFDKLILLTYILKIVNLVLSFVVIMDGFLIFESFMIFKSILDLYFCFISLKMCILGTCFININEKLNSLWVWIKSTFCCVEEEEPSSSDIEYTKFDNLDSQ